MYQRLPDCVRVVVFDVGETLVDESRMWAQQAHAVGVSPFTLMGVIGALIEQQESHHKAWDILGVEAPKVGTRIRPADLYPDALDCLWAARDTDFVIGIAGNQPAGTTSCLRAVGFDADFIASSAEWGVAKPSNRFFSLIAGASSAEPGEILYVGDRLDNDIIPAAESGFKTALLRRGPWGQIHSRRVDSSRADIRLDSLTELASIFRAGSSGARAERSANDPRRDDPVIRTVRASDADHLVDLFDDLSHPAGTGQIRIRVRRLLEDDTYMMWVAENFNGGIDGFAAGHIVYPIEDDAPAGQLIALVTSPHARGTGIGVKLSEAFERWATSKGAGRAVVNSSQDRHTSHEFYEHLGWEQTGLRFGKRLDQQ